MNTEPKKIGNRTKTGKLNFSVKGGSAIFGERKTANSIDELIDIMPKRMQKSWEIIEFRDDAGNRVCVTREFMDEGGMTLEEVLIDWGKNAEDDEFKEPIFALGTNWGERFEF